MFINYLSIKHIGEKRCNIHPKLFCRVILKFLVKSIIVEMAQDLGQVIHQGHNDRSGTFISWFNNYVGDNISAQERIALFSLRSRTDIAIEPADKGSAMVILSLEDYLTKVKCYLNNGQLYEKLQYDPTEQFLDDTMSDLANMLNRRVIDKHTFEFLCPQDARTSQFYILPKLHKVGIPGRLIVSSCGSPIDKISLFVVLQRTLPTWCHL